MKAQSLWSIAMLFASATNGVMAADKMPLYTIYSESAKMAVVQSNEWIDQKNIVRWEYCEVVGNETRFSFSPKVPIANCQEIGSRNLNHIEKLNQNAYTTHLQTLQISVCGNNVSLNFINTLRKGESTLNIDKWLRGQAAYLGCFLSKEDQIKLSSRILSHYHESTKKRFSD